MPEPMHYLNLTKDAIKDVGNMASEIDKIIKKGNEQADTRKASIQTINEMCDALQLACDLVSKELSGSITEFNRIKRDTEEALRGFFERAAFKFSYGSLRLLLHDGKVCSELHALGDRFSQPFSDVSTGGLSIWENVKTFFTRSNSMSEALHGLHKGEVNYLHGFSEFLNEIRNRSENATGIDWGNEEQLRQAGEELIAVIRQTRQTLQDQLRDIRMEADACIEKLH